MLNTNFIKEDTYRKFIQIQNHSFLLEIRDTAGQAEFINLLPQWIRDSEAILVGYSVTNRHSFDYSMSN